MESLCYSANKGSDDAFDVSTSLTGYEPNFVTFGELNDSSVPFSYIIPSSDQDMDDVTLGKLLTEAHRGQADYCEPEGMSVSQSSSSVVFDGSWKTDGERMVDRSGKPDEHNSSNAQIRTLLEEQRQMIIAEYREKVGHHELQAAHAEEERRLLREEIWRQQMEFREVHQQSLTEMEELRKFQSSTFNAIVRRKLIEDKNTIMELSERLQELQNEVDCMNDSEDFQDAESVRSGNSHVTSQPRVFPKHHPFQAMLRPSFISKRQTEEPPNIWDTSGISGNVFAHPQASSSAPYPQELNPWGTTIEEPIRMSTAENSGRPERDQDLRCQSGPSAKDSVIFSGGDYSKKNGQTNNDCDFWSSLWQVPYASNLCLLEDKIQDRGMFLFTISYGSDAMDQGSGVGWFSGWIEIFVVNTRYFNAEFWSTWCEDCLSPEQDHP